MMHYAAQVSYLGNAFSGWQRQPHAPSVQAVLEDALVLLNRGQKVTVAAAGRTDAGVHARGQVVSFSMERKWDVYRLLMALNANLPDGVRIVRIAPVTGDFHARRDARWREYVYFIWTAEYVYPHMAPFVWWNRRWRESTKLRQACSLLEGTHDFSAFCRLSECPPNPCRTIHSARLVRRGALVRLRIRGNAFLTNMVRIIVGNLDQIARGRRDPDWFARLLKGGDRTQSGQTAPAGGLFFWRVAYTPSPWE